MTERASPNNFDYGQAIGRLTGLSIEAGYPQNNTHFNLHYNADGHIQRVTQTNSANNSDQLIATYQYNPRRERIQKTLANGRSERYFYGLNQELLKRERYGTNNQLLDTRYYLWLDHTPLAVIDLKAGSSSPRITHIHSDHLGTPRAASNSAGQIIWQWHSDPFGNTPPNQGPDGDGKIFELNLRFPGQYYDQESGLHYNLNRYYDPRTGRYLESDPIGLAGGLNTYAYASNNSVNFVDPLGLRNLPGMGGRGADDVKAAADALEQGLCGWVPGLADCWSTCVLWECTRVDQCSQKLKTYKIGQGHPYFSSDDYDPNKDKNCRCIGRCLKNDMACMWGKKRPIPVEDKR